MGQKVLKPLLFSYTFVHVFRVISAHFVKLLKPLTTFLENWLYFCVKRESKWEYSTTYLAGAVRLFQ